MSLVYSYVSVPVYSGLRDLARRSTTCELSMHHRVATYMWHKEILILSVNTLKTDNLLNLLQ